MAVVPDDVAEHQHGRAVGLQEGVVPVAIDLRLQSRRAVPRDDLQVVGLRGRGEQRPLQAVDELALGGLPLGDLVSSSACRAIPR